MSNQPKKQQASLFSFFKKSDSAPVSKPDAATDTAKAVPSSAPISAVKIVPKPPPAPVSSEKKPAGSVAARSSPSPNKVPAVVTISKLATVTPASKDELHDTDDDDDSFALGKKRRLQKAQSNSADKMKSDSASKKAKTTPEVPDKKKDTKVKKGTLSAMEDDDEEAEWASSSSDEEDASVYSGGSDDDDDMDVDDEDESVSDNDDEEEDDDDDYGKRKKKRTSAAPKARPLVKKVISSTSTSKPVAKITPNKPPLANSTSSVKTPAKVVGKTTNTLAMFTPTGNQSDANDENTPQASNQLTSSASKVVLPEGVMAVGKHDHDSYSFLFPENIRDANNRRPTDAFYNPRTVKVPPKFMADQTPAMAQWWQFKSQNMDTVLFFKVGKFYELFHMDADIGFKELDLIYMKGTKAHSGFPEVSYGKFASILVTKGYRVARVEQTETPDMLKERNDSAAKGVKKEKVVIRELCSIMTKGTRTFSHMDDLTILEELGPDATSTSLLLCICELDFSSSSSNADHSQYHHLNTHGAWAEYGLCAIDTVLSTVTLAQFQDDRQRTRLRTFLARFNPTEILVEDNHVSKYTNSVIQLLAPNAAVETLRVIDQDKKNPELLTQEMPTAKDTLHTLTNGFYFPVHAETKTVQLPTIVQMLQDAFVASEEEQGSLALRALGGCLWQLKRSLIDHEIISMGSFEAYVPPDDHLHDVQEEEEEQDQSWQDDSVERTDEKENNNATNNAMVCDDAVEEKEEKHDAGKSTSFFSSINTSQHLISLVSDDADEDNHQQSMFASAIAPVAKQVMILDETTLTNLEVLTNSYDKSEKHSLWHFLNHTVTLGGRRLLRSWLCHPLFRIEDIRIRQEAVQELCDPDDGDTITFEKMKKYLRLLPDLERLLLRVHSNGLKKKHFEDATKDSLLFGEETEHPDHRAVMFESTTYTMRKIKDFADCLAGFEHVSQLADLAAKYKWQSSLLQYLLGANSDQQQHSTGGNFPLKELQKILAYFRDIFDEKQAKRDGQIKPKPGINPDYDHAMERIAQLHQDLESYLKEMKRSTGINDMVYFGNGKDRFQLEIPLSQLSKVPHAWQSKSQKKTHRRYWTTYLEESVQQLLKLEDEKSMAQQDTLRQLFAKFDEYRRLWKQCAETMSVLDALLSLAQVSSLPNYTWPEIVPEHTTNSTFTTTTTTSNGTNNVQENKSINILGGGYDYSQGDQDTGVFLEIVQGRHPMLEQSLLAQQSYDTSSSSSSSTFIPNSLQLGGCISNGATTNNTTVAKQKQYCARTLVLTGPNMGGKSTLLRMTCLLTLLGQLGCKIPASRCRYTPIDRIFTRLGASDRILAGQSTFFVELAETSLLLRAATSSSLCILDELGRGTATYDGTAIAHSVLQYLVSVIQCRVLFATHYHVLVEEWQYDSRVSMGHMDCLVQTTPLTTAGGTTAMDTDNKTNDDEKDVMVEEVTFLYRLCAGSSPKSYGINVARLAGLPVEVIQMALSESARFHQQQQQQFQQNTNTSNNSNSNNSDKNAVVYRVMMALLERLVSLAHTQIPQIKNSNGDNNTVQYKDSAVQELAYHAQELYQRFAHLSQHHRLSDILQSAPQDA